MTENISELSNALNHLKRLEKMLYRPKPLTGDERRDLANLVNQVILPNVQYVHEYLLDNEES